VSRRSRIVAFGSAAAVALAGALCAVFVHGLTGQLLAFVLIAFGLGAIVLLLFLEVGLSEDRDRAQEDERRQAQTSKPRIDRGPRWRAPRWRRRP
jgi:hypothetical protein